MSELKHDWQTLDPAGNVVDLRPSLAPFRQATGPVGGGQDAAAKALEGVKAWPCDTPEQYEQFAIWRVQCSAKHKELDERRKKLTGPLNKAKREVDSWFAPTLKAYVAALAVINRKVLAYRRLAEAQKLEAQAAIQVHHQQQDYAAIVRESAALAPPPKVAGLHFAKRKTWVVKDFAAIPDQYKQLDEAKVREAMKAGAVIPGLEWTTVEVPTASRK